MVFFDMGWVPRAAWGVVAACGDAEGEADDHKQPEDDHALGARFIALLAALLGVVGVVWGVVAALLGVVVGVAFAAIVLEVPLALAAAGGWCNGRRVGGLIGGGAGGRATGGRAALALYLVVRLPASLDCRATRAGARLNV